MHICVYDFSYFHMHIEKCFVDLHFRRRSLSDERRVVLQGKSVDLLRLRIVYVEGPLESLFHACLCNFLVVPEGSARQGVDRVYNTRWQAFFCLHPLQSRQPEESPRPVGQFGMFLYEVRTELHNARKQIHWNLHTDARCRTDLVM